MAFTYQAPENRAANSIAALMLRRGETGAIWGNVLRNIGQDVGNTIQQATDPRRQLELQALQRQKELQAGQKTVDQALQPVQPQGPQEPGQPAQQAKSPYLTDDGLFDIPKLTNVLAASGQAHLAPDLLKGAEAINDSIVKHQELQTQVQTLQQKAADQHTILLGDMADGVQKLVKGGTPIDQALDLVTQPGRATGRFSEQEYQQVRQQLLQAPPDQQQVMLGQLKTAAERVAPPLKQGEIGRYGTPLGPPKSPSTPTELQFDAVSPTSPTAAQSKAAVAAENAAKRQPEPKSLQTKSVLLDGKPAELTFDPADGSWKQGTTTIDPSRVKPIPAAALQVNAANAAAAAKPIEQGSKEYRVAQDLAYGKLTFQDFTRLFPSRGSGPQAALRSQIYDTARDLNPNFDPAQFELGYKMAANPQIRQRLVAIDSLGPVIDKIDALVKENGNTDLPALNRLINAGKFQLGGKTATDLRQLQTLLGDEVGNALGVGSGSDLKTHLGLDLVNPNLSPANFASTMDQLKSVLNARRDTLLKTLGPYGGQNADQAGAPKVGDVKTFPNGNKGRWDGTGWELVK